MKTYILILVSAFMFFQFGCNDEIIPPKETPENWDYPANGTKFAVTLYSEKDTVRVGNEFDVKVIFYNIPNVFGTAFEIGYASDKIKINKQLTGPHFTDISSYLFIATVDSAENTASYGITYQAGSNKQSSGSGVVMKFKCKAKTTGTAQFTINKQELEIKKSNGSLIDNFNDLVVEDISIVVK